MLLLPANELATLNKHGFAVGARLHRTTTVYLRMAGLHNFPKRPCSPFLLKLKRHRCEHFRTRLSSPPWQMWIHRRLRKPKAKPSWKKRAVWLSNCPSPLSMPSTLKSSVQVSTDHVLAAFAALTFFISWAFAQSSPAFGRTTLSQILALGFRHSW